MVSYRRALAIGIAVLTTSAAHAQVVEQPQYFNLNIYLAKNPTGRCYITTTCTYYGGKGPYQPWSWGSAVTSVLDSGCGEGKECPVKLGDAETPPKDPSVSCALAIDAGVSLTFTGNSTFTTTWTEDCVAKAKP